MLKWSFFLIRQWLFEDKNLGLFIFLTLALSIVPDTWQDLNKYLQENKQLMGEWMHARRKVSSDLTWEVTAESHVLDDWEVIELLQHLAQWDT